MLIFYAKYVFIHLSLSRSLSLVVYSNHVSINSSDSASVNRFRYYIKFFILLFSKTLKLLIILGKFQMLYAGETCNIFLNHSNGISGS